MKKKIKKTIILRSSSSSVTVCINILQDLQLDLHKVLFNTLAASEYIFTHEKNLIQNANEYICTHEKNPIQNASEYICTQDKKFYLKCQ